MKGQHYQVAIIGAGPAGSTCAIQLARLGLDRVLLVESGDYEKFRIGESIPPDTNVLLHQLGIYPDFVAEQHEPCYGSCSYWGDERRGYNDFLLSPHGNGWHLDRRRFNHFLAQKAQSLGVELLTQTRFQQAQALPNGGFSLALQSEKAHSITVTVDKVVDASGARGVFAATQGSQKMQGTALICLGVRFALSDQTQKISKLTHLESVENGWWYAARLPNETLLVALYTTAAVAKALNLNQIEAWMSSLKSTPNTHQLSEGLVPIDDRPQGFPAPSFRLDRVAGADWLAIGDTATAYDPITAQGIIKSMVNARSAAHQIHQNLAGEIEDFSQYVAEIDEAYGQYLLMRRYFYQLEQRWLGSLFWREMHGV